MVLLRGLPLYRAILREHRRKLPIHLRKLGDEYVKSEFRQHRSASQADILTSFHEEWNTYLHHLQAHTRTHTEPFNLGAPLSEKEIENLSLEQREQLQKLKEEAAKAAERGGGKEPPPASLG